MNGLSDYPHWLFTVASNSDDRVTGTATFIYQDGRTDDFGDYTAVLESESSPEDGDLLFTFANGKTLQGTFQPDAFSLENCGSVLAWTPSAHTGCAFSFGEDVQAGS